VIQGGLRDMPPMGSVAVRFTIAAVVMLGLAGILHRREGGRAPAAWLWILTGTLNFAVPYSLVYYAETQLPSGLVSVLWAVFPMMMAGAGHFLLPGERLGRVQWLGFALGLLGVFVLFHRDVAAFGDAGLEAGLLLLLSPLCATVGTVLLKRYGEDTSSVLLNRNSMALGAMLMLAAAFALENGIELTWSVRAWASIAYLAIVGTVVSFGLYFWALRWAPANHLSLISYVTPCVALGLGWLVGGEQLHASTVLGTTLIVGGVVFAMRKP